MRKKRPRMATLDEVSITRDGEYAVVEFHDQTISTMHLKLGPEVKHMSDREILNKFNETVLAMEETARRYVHVPVEIPPGKPQVRYFAHGDQWCPRGDVLRCIVDDGGPDCEATIWIDDREFSLREFGRLLVTHAGWGMRVTFVPDTELEKIHPVEVREPEDDSE